MKSILFLVLCLGLRNISGQPTKAKAGIPNYAALNYMTGLFKMPYAVFAQNSLTSALMSGSAFDVHTECLKYYGKQDGDGDGIITRQEFQEYAQSPEISSQVDKVKVKTIYFELFATLSADKNMYPIEKACKVTKMIANIPLAQSSEDAIKSFGDFYRYFDENKDGQLSDAEVFFPMDLMESVGLPIEDLFGKHEESISVSIEGN